MTILHLQKRIFYCKNSVSEGFLRQNEGKCSKNFRPPAVRIRTPPLLQIRDKQGGFLKKGGFLNCNTPDVYNRIGRKSGQIPSLIPALVRPNRRACPQVTHTANTKQVFSERLVVLKTVFVFVRGNSPSNPPGVDSKIGTKLMKIRISILNIHMTVSILRFQRETNTIVVSVQSCSVCANTKRLAR